MGATREGAVVVPDDEQGEEARREDPMNGEMGTQDTVPVLDGAAGPDGRFPGVDEQPSGGLPGREELSNQVIAAGAEDGAALPGPGDQRDPVVTEDDGSILLDAVERRREDQQAGQGQGDVPVQAHQLGLLRGGGGRGQLVQQREQGGQVSLPSRSVEQAVGVSTTTSRRSRSRPVRKRSASATARALAQAAAWPTRSVRGFLPRGR